MGTRWSVTVWHALPDFEGAEREFLDKLYDEVFATGSADECDETDDRQVRFHHAHSLPATVRDWLSVQALDRNGQTYLTAANPVSPSLIPPFPTAFGDHHWIYRRTPLPAPWHVLFGAAEREVRDSRIFVSLEAARRHYAHAFAGIGLLLDWAGRHPEELRARTPRFSDGWSIIRKLLTLFEPGEYFQVIWIISRAHGGRALLELDFSEELQTDENDPDETRVRRQQFLEKNEALNRILRSARECDVPSLAREVPVQGGYTDDPRSVVRWLTHYDRDFVRSFLNSIPTEDERNVPIKFTFV